MATEISTLIQTIRQRVGDTNSGSYLIDDTGWTSIINKVNYRLLKYARNSKEDDTTEGSGISVYDIPNGVIGGKILDIWIRYNDEPQTDRPVKTTRINGGKIYLPFTINLGEKLVYWYSVPYQLGVDTLPDYILEIVLTMLEIEWYSYAIARRGDFEQWAAITRSDTRIGELIAAKREAEKALSEYASVLATQMTVTDIGGGI